MGEGYELRARSLEGPGEDTRTIAILARRGRPSFLDKLSESGRGRHDAALIQAAAWRLVGTTRSIAVETGLLKPLRGTRELAVFELRPGPRRSVVRVMTYLHDGRARDAVLLFPFESHRGGSGAIPSELIRKASELASISRGLLEGREKR